MSIRVHLYNQKVINGLFYISYHNNSHSTFTNNIYCDVVQILTLIDELDRQLVF